MSFRENLFAKVVKICQITPPLKCLRIWWWFFFNFRQQIRTQSSEFKKPRIFRWKYFFLPMVYTCTYMTSSTTSMELISHCLNTEEGKEGEPAPKALWRCLCAAGCIFLPQAHGYCLPSSWNHSRLCYSSSLAAFCVLAGGRKRLFLAQIFLIKQPKITSEESPLLSVKQPACLAWHLK